ncbi:MAG: hypothetical protein QJQ54_00680 [Mollicutes bacterium]|nr:MAG: hypothetical protein QJQ54_00680 [Mollicutes bacterium]
MCFVLKNSICGFDEAFLSPQITAPFNAAIQSLPWVICNLSVTGHASSKPRPVAMITGTPCAFTLRMAAKSPE